MLKRITGITLIILLSVGFLPGRLVWADETGTTGTTTTLTTTDSAPTPSPDPSPSVTDGTASDPTPTPTTESLSVDPSPTPSPCPSDCPVITQQNEAEVENEVTAASDTGNNTVGDTAEVPSDIQSDQSTQSAAVEGEGGREPSANNNQDNPITTGDAATSVDVVNQVNTNIADSSYSLEVRNLYLDENGNIDFSGLGDLGQLPSALVFVRDQNNNATVVNLIYASANTGQNSVLGTGDVQSGNAFVSVNLLNFINSNFAGSTLQLVVFNIFGNLSGNIVLPDDFGQATGPSSAEATEGEQTEGEGRGSQQNDADIQNSVEATSNSGTNNADGNVTTGNATTAVNIANFANFNIFGGNFAGLIINNLGEWNGQFLGWGANGPSAPVFGLMSFDFGYLGSDGFDQACGCLGTSQSNSASVQNQVFASANTGGNTTLNGSVMTGRAFSAVNIFNFVNANIINAKGFFGIINIFGTLNGDIGGASNFATTEGTEGNTENTENTNQADVHGPGGALGTTLSTNVGSHVNPGDTVTFFATAGNSGTGPVYDGKVIFNLYDPNGNLAAVQTFDLGKLDAGRVARISFGLVLADTAPGGTYSALIQASGKVGPDDSTILSNSQTSFEVGFPLGTFIAGGSIVPDVLAASTVGDGGAGEGAGVTGVASSYNWMEIVFMLLGYMGMLYIAQRLLIRPYRIAIYYLGRRQWPQIRGRAIASRLLSRFASGAMALRHFLF